MQKECPSSHSQAPVLSKEEASHRLVSLTQSRIDGLLKSSIPSNATRVFQGLTYDVYQWEQVLFDGTTTLFEKLKRKDTVDIIAISENGQICLLEEEQPSRAPFTGLIGGTCEKGEEPTDTAKRELLEETGMISEDWQLYRLYARSSRIEHKAYVFVARNCKKIQDQNLDSGERISVQNLSWEQFIEKVADPTFRVQEFALEVLRHTYFGSINELKQLIYSGKTTK